MQRSLSSRGIALLWFTWMVSLPNLLYGLLPSRCSLVSLQKRQYRSSSKLLLNRFLFDESEVNFSEGSAAPTVTLNAGDYRTVHAAKVLGLQNGDVLRAGIVNGQITDSAAITWIPEGKIKKAQPTKNGDPPGSLLITLQELSHVVDKSRDDTASRVSLLLALPRPLALSRILPMVAQMGVDELILSTAQKVPKDYFGSHLFRKPEELRRLLIEGLCQAGDVRLPKIRVVKRLKPFLEDELENIFPSASVAKVIAHPSRSHEKQSLRMRDIQFPSSVEGDNDKRLLLAVGPEGGWAEDYELDLFESHGFQRVTLGTRTLRSDVAVVSLLSLAHDVVCSR